jgi:CheY-like chemotaxis protein
VRAAKSSVPTGKSGEENPTVTKLLLVDADPFGLRVLDVGLRKAGYSVTTAIDAAEALEQIEATEPDVIVAETRLPGRNGFALVRAMRERAHFAAIPVILMASRDSEDDRRLARELGVEDYLPGRVYLNELSARIELMLAQRAQRSLEKQAATSSRGRLEGSTHEMALIDLLQSIGESQKSGVAHIRNGLQEARIYFRDGRLLDAELGSLRGEEAIYRALIWDAASFEVEFRPVSNEDLIDRPMQSLVMKSMRRVDEWVRLCAQVQPLAALLDVHPTQLLERLSSLSEIPEALKAMVRLPPRPPVRPELSERAAVDPQVTATHAVSQAPPATQPAAHAASESVAHEKTASPGEKGLVAAVAAAEPASAPAIPSLQFGELRRRASFAPSAAATASAPPTATATPTTSPSTTATVTATPMTIPTTTATATATPMPIAMPIPTTTANGAAAASGEMVTQALDADAHPAEEPVVPRAPPPPRISSLRPSSAPWTREVGVGVDAAESDLFAPGVPRAMSVKTKYLGAAGAMAAFALFAGLMLHSVRTKQLREAEEMRSRNVAVVGTAAFAHAGSPPATAVAQPPSPAAAASSAPRTTEEEVPPPPTGNVEPAAPSLPESTVAQPVPAAVAGAGDVPAALPAIASHDKGHETALDMRYPMHSESPLVRDAQLSLLKGDTAHAMDLAQNAVLKEPSDADAWLTLAAARKASGDFAGATDAYHRCSVQAQTAGVTHCRVLGQIR